MEEIKQKAHNDELNETYDEIHSSETQRELSNPDFLKDCLKKKGCNTENLENKNSVN